MPLRGGVIVAAALIAGLMLLPLGYLVLRVAGSDVDLATLAASSRTAGLVGRTLGFVAVVTILGLVIGLPLAWLTVRTDLPWRGFWEVALALPLAIPSYVGGYAFVAALGPRGLVQQLLAPFGVDRIPELYGFGGATIVLVGLTYPYVLLSVRSALLRLDPALEEAARGLGSSGWSAFWGVVLPQLRPAATSGALLVGLYALSEFGAVSLLRLDTFTRAIYVQYQASFDRTTAAALAMLLVVLTGVVLLVELAARGRGQYFRSTRGSQRPLTPLRLGGWRLPALALCCLVFGLALALPTAVLLYWAARGLLQGVRLEVLWQATAGSVTASGLAGLAAVLAAMPTAVLSARRPTWVASALERATYAGYALPGIVIALSLVFFGANFVPWLYQTLPMLVLAYVIRFLPQAIGPLRGSLLQVSPHLEEAARGLGRNPVRAWAETVLPLILPGVFAGIALVFLTAMKELPATLLLSPTGYRTLAVATWSGASEGLFAEAALPALALLLCSAPPLYLLLVQGRQREPRAAALSAAE